MYPQVIKPLKLENYPGPSHRGLTSLQASSPHCHCKPSELGENINSFDNFYSNLLVAIGPRRAVRH